MAQGLSRDIERLAAIERGSATDGERRSAEWVAGRLREQGAEDVRIEPFAYQGTFAHAQALHFAIRLVAVGAWTDPVLARLAGLPAISILSVRDGGFPNYHLPSDTPDRVDLECAGACVRAAHAIALSA